MKALFSIAWRSAWNRRFTLALTVFSIALSTFLLLGVERIRTELRENFASSVSGTDLIVGARTGSTQLLLYSVFRIGAATNNISWKSVQALEAHPGVDWVVPLSLGDSHRGFAVLATSPEYFTRFRYGDRQLLKMREGKPFSELFDAVVGAEVADKLGYHVGQKITLAHGSGELNVAEQVVNVAVSTVMVDAWARGQKVKIHGWTFGVHDGLLQDLGLSVDGTQPLEGVYKAAVQRIRYKWGKPGAASVQSLAAAPQPEAGGTAGT